MAADTSVTGAGILWTILESTHGRMAGCMRVSTERTRSMVSVCTLGAIRRDTQAGGA